LPAALPKASGRLSTRSIVWVPQYVAPMAIAIEAEEAIRQLEEALRLTRDPAYEVSQLWLDRIGELEAWRTNKLALTAFATAVLAKATEAEVDPLWLIDRSGDPHSFNARTLAREVLVPTARRLGFLLGTPGPDPLAGSPWFGPERIDEIDKWRAKAKLRADDLVGWLAGLTQETAREALVALVLRRSQVLQREVDERREALVTAEASVSLTELAETVDRFIRRNPEDGRRGAAATAAAFSAVGREVLARPVNDPAQIDVDVMDEKGLLWLGIEVKQRPATEQDALDIAAGVNARGASRAMLCAFAQKGEALSHRTLIKEAEAEYGCFLHFAESAGELIRLAALSTEADRPSILREFPPAFSHYLEELGSAQEALVQWKALAARWER
jgi:hypothetical protein